MDRAERRYDLDWIRVIGIMAVFAHHIMMFFNSWPWHAKNNVTTPAFEPLNLALLAWIMPIFFAISGVATHHALNHRAAAGFVKERLLRLGVPVLVSALLLSPHQVYSERVTTGEFAGSFLDFLPRYFDGWYAVTPGGNFAWMGLHTWYLLVLLVFSAVTLPFFLRARATRRPGILGRLIQASGPMGVLLLVPALILVLEGVLFALGLDASQSGWPFGVYLAYYVIGYSLLPGDLFRTAVRKWGALALLGVAATVVPVAFIPEPAGFGAAFVAWQAAKVYNCWLWVMGLFYLGDRYLNRNSPALQYWNEAVMPFYILHQPVIVAVGAAVRSLPIHTAAKFPLLLGASFAIVMTLYHVVVRQVNPLRFLLGMKPRRLRQAGNNYRVDERRRTG